MHGISDKREIEQAVGFCQKSSVQKSHEAQSCVASWLAGLQTVFLPHDSALVMAATVGENNSSINDVLNHGKSRYFHPS